ncbi:RNB-domain-containing protein [Hortaea werneckii]|nr:RNB-domain-containing protein [Hortaea werneckii]KAI7109909.1 RNB-domain-containing protein [Hortaea werneckii]KAI7241615.1 RNB-domain-containing protein [Hortaea werneckii]KAI7338631.1 RNB-domain-containing protein [Hortaea werneckii]
MMQDPKKWESPHGIRAQLRKWQDEYGHEEDLRRQEITPDNDPNTGEATNNLTRLPDEKTAFTNTQAEQEEEEREAMAHFMQAPADEPSASERNTRFLSMGDLVEIEFIASEKEPLIALFVRRVGANLAQFYTMQGRWIHMQEKKVQYAIPGWFSKEDVEPLLPYLPKPETVESDLGGLMEEAAFRDLSVPRHVASPLVKGMVQFDEGAKAIYRKHAATLDNAHNLLAHDTDLRYGSLSNAARDLLKLPRDKIPLTALYAVRQALSHAGFAFNVDRRSHRLTGYLQIRSKEQVRMVEQVRRWLREWQDDLATLASKGEKARARHRSSRGAKYVYDFLEKAKKIILRSREDRQPTASNIGPSKVRFPVTEDAQCVRITKSEEFTEQDTELVRFIEAWSLSQMFQGLPRIEALPPLLLQATGLYDEFELKTPTGLLFLQELGTVMPYENRVRFDQHLLLPSSQHSKPLQNLMTSLIEMGNNHSFVDTMEDLRHDWKELPVYCIDDAGAHEIDDGISVENAAVADSVPKEWWVHTHIANPTAFFGRDHALSKMARHMGETIYMPERTYMMLPRWATSRHFSLGKDRPCLTFSARLNENGEILENKIQAGRVRNVFRLTPQEVKELLGIQEGDDSPETVLTVGGEPPKPKERSSHVPRVHPEHVEQLRTLKMLAEKRLNLRAEGGGLFFETDKPRVDVWQNARSSGLAWDHPHRKGSRRVEGDPVIQMRTRGMRNWFSPFSDAVGTTVRESMLLACEVAARWCAERQIPAIFRGSVHRPDKMDSGVFYRNILVPAAEKSEKKGEYPMHLGLRYLETFGSTELRTKPFKHKVLGMDAYGKVTSPLRRYGDMITHWQIEGSLREEARTGQSLITTDQNASRAFLPFSEPALNMILVGLQPRENIILRAKQYAENFWMTMLLFRAVHFNEIELPFPHADPDPVTGRRRPIVHAYLHVPPSSQSFQSLAAMIVELNLIAAMTRPDGGAFAAKQGDVWECEIDTVDCFRRMVFLAPRRLVERVED